MRAYIVPQGSTGFDDLTCVERERPTPRAGQVLVRMRAASLNFRDLAVANGKYIRGPVDRDTIPLSDGAGEVVAVGDEVESFTVADRVVATFEQGRPPSALGSPLDGTLCEFAVFDADGLLKIPDFMTFEEAASLPCAGVTAWAALFGGIPIKPGHTVVTLGTGGVSVFALQLAKLAGARVIVTSSSDEKLERARALGADDTINYVRHRQWEREVEALTDGRGADKVVDLGGVGTLPHSYQAVGAGGEVLVIGVMTRPQGDLSPYPLMLKRASVRGVSVGDRADFQGLLQAIVVNDLHPVIDRVFEFDAAVQAYAHLKSAQHFGKIVIRIQ